MKVELVIGNKNYSSWSLRAWLLLAEAGIDFVERRIALDVASTAAELSKYSPAGRVPVLILDGHTVWDSLAIAETVAERWPDRKLWPDDFQVRAHARSICAEMHSGFAVFRESMPMNCRAMGRKVALPEPLARDIDRVFEIWADCQSRYAAGDGWLFGRFSVADAMYAPVVLRFRTYGINLPQSASRYAARLLESPAMQEWLVAAESEVEVIDREEIG
ncbi:MAG: glutathione S-transferase family protein [Woeseiaceae bacterium]